MRENRVKAALRRGEAVCGTFLTMLAGPGLVELVGLAGFDLVIFDDQHGWLNPETTAALIRTAENVGLTPLVRVAEIHSPSVGKFLDLGAQGIVFPLVNSADDARRAVATVRYEPHGLRSSCPSVRAAGYTLAHWPTVYERASQDILTMIIIETREGFDNLEAILEVDGVDAVLPGPFDLASSLGLPGQTGHLEVVRRVHRAQQMILGRGLTLCALGLDEKAMLQAAEEGARVLLPSVTTIIASTLCERVAAIRRSANALTKAE